MKAGSAKTMPDEHPAKQAYNKMKDDGGDDKEEPSGQKLGGSDFDRDSGDDSDGRDDKPNEDDDDYAKMTDDAQEKVAKKYGLSAMQLYDNAGKEPEDFNSWEEYENHLNDVAKDLVDKGYSDPYADEPSDMDTERPDDEPEDEVPGDNAPDDKPKEGGAKSISDDEFEKLATFGDYSYKTTDNYQTAEDDNMMGSVRSSIYKDIIKKTGVDPDDFIDIAGYYDEEDYDTLGDYYDDLMKQAKEDAKEMKGESFLKEQLERFGGLK
tara:strand:- start:29 stop:826 length:798 start_codon:yes stop_codon:yes gene_type:complete